MIQFCHKIAYIYWNQFAACFGCTQGTMEMLVAGAICGLLYALFAGQPLTIVGATGPMLVFESIIFRICKYDRSSLP